MYACENDRLHRGGTAYAGRVVGGVAWTLGPDKTFLGRRFSEDERHFVRPWHGWEHHVRTGECGADRGLRLKRYDVVCRSGAVYVVL